MMLQAGSRPVPNCPDYTLICKIGAGAFGEVWHARGPGGLDVALKFIRLDAHACALELRSLEVMKSIRHPNLVSLCGAWRKDDWLILAMELCDRSLQDRLNEVRSPALPGIPAKELLEYMRDAASGLDALNAKQVQHRDVKPANLLLLDSGVKVADFGLAKMLEQTVATNSGAGTLAYTAPECFKGKLAQQSDQYSLAVTYYHLRTGHLLFKGDQAQVMYAHLELEPDVSPLLPAERVVLARALSKEPGKRWPNCKAFVGELTNAYQAFDVRSLPSYQKILSQHRFLMRLKGAGHLPPETPSLRLPHAEEVSPGLDEGLQPLLDEAKELGVERRGRLLSVGQVPAHKWLLDVFRSIRSQIPEHVRFSQDRVARILGGWSKEFSDQAVRELDEAIRLDAEFVDAYNSRGLAWYFNQDYDLAIKDFGEAIRLDPAFAFTYVKRGDAWSGKKDYDRAIRDYDEAIRLNPRNVVYRGRAWSAKRDYGQAIKDFGEAIRLDPRDSLAYYHFAWLLATCPDDQVRDGKRAIQLARKIVELGGWPWQLDALAAAYAEAGQFDEAERYQMKALEGPFWLPEGTPWEPDREDFRRRLELYKQRKP